MRNLIITTTGATSILLCASLLCGCASVKSVRRAQAAADAALAATQTSQTSIEAIAATAGAAGDAAAKAQSSADAAKAAVLTAATAEAVDFRTTTERLDELRGKVLRIDAGRGGRTQSHHHRTKPMQHSSSEHEGT